jgi:Xaa-Pro dipeptidase
VPVARGLGLGFDLPLVTHLLPASAGEENFEAGMVFALTAFVWKEGRGALYIQEPVYMSATGPELLCATPFHEQRSS